MATMGTVQSQDEYIKKATQGFTDNANSQIDTRKASDEEYITKFNETTDAATQATTKQYQGRIDKADSKFQGQYDANAVAQAVQQRQLKESMANMGLTNSGLSATNQTALAVQRNNADASTRAQQQNYVTDLESAIDAAVAKGEQSKATNANETRKKTADWGTDLLTKAYEQGQKYGRDDYNSDYNKVWKQYVMDVEQEEAEKGRQHDIYMQDDSQAWQSQENATERSWQSGESEKQRGWQSQENATERSWQSGESEKQRGWQSAENSAERTWQSGESEKQRGWQSAENSAERTWQSDESEKQRDWQSVENRTSNWTDTQMSSAASVYSSKGIEGLRDMAVELGDQYGWTEDQIIAFADAAESKAKRSKK